MADKLFTIKQQPRFYQTNFRRLLILSYALVALIFILSGLTYYQYFTQPNPQYFATTSGGRLIEVQPIQVKPND